MPNFHQRVRKLELATKKPFVCKSCGAGELLPRQVVHLSMHGSLGECESCGGLVAEDGWPVGTPCITVQCGERMFSR